MDFSEPQDIGLLKENIGRVLKAFPDDYWRVKDERREFPQEFFDNMAAHDWFKLNIPAEYGGANLGMSEVAEIIRCVAKSPAGVIGADLFMATLVFAGQTLLRFGSEFVKRKYLRSLSEGKVLCSFCLTEPRAGVNTPDIETFARYENGKYFIFGQKIWITLAHLADLMVVVTRTTPKKASAKRTYGITLFAVDVGANKSKIRTKRIDGATLKPLASNQVFFEGVEAEDSEILGEKDKGWRVLASLLNAERISTASMSIGAGEILIEKAAANARDREVFGRPIGENQAIQFPLAECKVDLESAWVMTQKAAWLYDHGLDCAFEANVAAFLGGRAANNAADRAIQTFGGMGFANESNLERYWRDLRLFRTGPVPEEMVLSYIGQHVLGMPRTY